jgi:hypothetical protein
VRAFVGTGRQVLSTSKILCWSHPRPVRSQRHNPRTGQRESIRRVCAQLCERVGRDSSIGRPILWRLRHTEKEP